MGLRERITWLKGLHSYGNSKMPAKGNPNEGWHQQGLEDGGVGAPLYHHTRLLRLELPKYRPSSDTSRHGNFNPIAPGLSHNSQKKPGRQ